MVRFYDLENDIFLEGEINMSPLFLFDHRVQYEYEYDFLTDSLDNLIGFYITHKGKRYFYSKKSYEVSFEQYDNGEFKTITMKSKSG